MPLQNTKITKECNFANKAQDIHVLQKKSTSPFSSVAVRQAISVELSEIHVYELKIMETKESNIQSCPNVLSSTRGLARSGKRLEK
jgi:hypothetical protein